MPILEIRGVSVRFGGHMAVDDVTIDVAAGEITGLIGPNGAGKTTTFNIITGLQAPTRGSIFLGGVDVTKKSAYTRSRLGIGRTFQRLELFGSLTTFDNVLTAAELNRVEGRSPRDITAALLDRIGIAELADQRADSLSTGNARLLELARALACQPRVLLLDEPASGLDEAETERFSATLLDLAEAGLGILMVEHDVPLVMRLCRQITVLNFGRVLSQGTPAQIQADPLVIDAYLGQGPGVGETA
ncbi:MAG: ABC transporter ATP-binding protein [Aquihabitans sp.]